MLRHINDTFALFRAQRHAGAAGAVVAVQRLRPYVSQSAEVRPVHYSVQLSDVLLKLF